MRVDDEDRSNGDTFGLRPSQGLLKLVDHIFVEAILGVGVGIDDLDLGSIAKIELESPVDGPAREDAVAWVSQAPGQDLMQWGSRAGDLDVFGGDGLVRLEILVEMHGQGSGETRPACGAEAVGELLRLEFDLVCMSRPASCLILLALARIRLTALLTKSST